MTSGFEMFTRKTLQMIIDRGIKSRAHFFQSEIKIYCRNLQYVEVPITYRAASPRLGASSLIESFQQLWRLFQLRLKGIL
jgi:dolichol-phosphate mannosyltransferase